MGDWAGLFEHARVRHHTLHVRDGAPFGISADTLRKRGAREGWERPFPGVLWLPGSGPGFWRTSAAVLASLPSTEAALTGRTAAYAHGMRDRPTPLTEVVQPHGRYIPKRRLVSVRNSRTLTDEDVVDIKSLRCTTPVRTITALAAVLEPGALRDVVIDAVQRKVFALDELAAACVRMSRSCARSRLRQVLAELAATPVDSPFEWEVATALTQRGLQPVTGFPWRCPDGRVIHLDLAFPSAWVAVECDGQGAHATAKSFTTDRIRWTQASSRWSLVWVEWSRWRAGPAAVVDEIVGRVTAATGDRPPARPADCRCPRCRSWRALATEPGARHGDPGTG